MKKKYKILILNTYYYCGGSVVLSELCRCFNELGYDAKVLVSRFFPEDHGATKCFSYKLWRSCIIAIGKIVIAGLCPVASLRSKLDVDYYLPRHLKRCRRKWLPVYNKNNTIVIYPEILFGNPLEAKNVVRWLLYFYKYNSQDGAYGDDDLFIGYRDVFSKTSPQEGINNYKVSFFDKDLYRRYNYGQRSGNCYIIRKGALREDLPKSFDGPIIDDLPEEKKVEVFNRCEYCYSYDTQTFLSSIASICGCRSVVVMEQGKTIADYTSGNDKRYGVSYGVSRDEIERAEMTRDNLISLVESFHLKSLEESQKLALDLERHFGVIIRK